MTAEANILSELKKVKEILATLRQQAKKDEKWVSAYWIQDVTGWDSEKLLVARRQNLIKFRRKGKQGVEYLLSSIPDQFIKKTA